VVIYLERGADLPIAQLMPLPLTVSCSSKIQIGFTFLVPAHPGRPGQRAIKRVCVCVCVQSHRSCVTVAVEIVNNALVGDEIRTTTTTTTAHASCSGRAHPVCVRISSWRAGQPGGPAGHSQDRQASVAGQHQCFTS